MNEPMTTKDFVEAMQQLSDRLFASASSECSGTNTGKIIAASLMRVANCIDDVLGPDEDDSDD